MLRTGLAAGSDLRRLKPHYDTVARVMNLQTIPDGQLTARLKLTREAAEKLGPQRSFSQGAARDLVLAGLALRARRAIRSQAFDAFVNAQGQQQGTCIHLGNCDIGCDVRAKNSLDLTYLPLAEKHGCVVRPLHVVRGIEPVDGGYRVEFDRIVRSRLVRGDARADRVFLAAGSLGTTELLLRARDEHAPCRSSRRCSAAAGRRMRTSCRWPFTRASASASRLARRSRPTIDFIDGVAGERFVVEDDGFPNLLLNALRTSVGDGAARTLGALASSIFRARPAADDPLSGVMLWLGAGVDAADGQLRLDRHLAPAVPPDTGSRWNADRSRGVIEAILAMHRRMTEATGGRPGSSSGGACSGAC